MMTVTVKAPRLGEGVDELTVGRWLAREGEAVGENAPLVELESDKVVTELPCPAEGILLRSLAREGDVVRVGDPLALVSVAKLKGKEQEAAPDAVPEAAPAGGADGATGATGAGGAIGAGGADSAPNAAGKTRDIGEGLQRRFLSPLARRLSELHGVDPSRIHGTGLGGRVMKQDILDFVAARGEPKAAPAPASGGRRAHSAARKRIAERMVESLRVSAQVLTVMEADIGPVMAHRSANKEAFAREGVRLTLTAYFVSAAASALRAHPAVNASWSDTALVIHPAVDIGLAVSLGESGLLVPVVRNADSLSLLQIARTVDDLASRARERKLGPEEVRGGTFTLTNHGSSGSLFATPIINQPQVAILGIGAVRKRAVVVETAGGDDAIAIRPMAYLSLVFDHRVMDGEGADRFLRSVKDALEEWK